MAPVHLDYIRKSHFGEDVSRKKKRLGESVTQKKVETPGHMALILRPCLHRKGFFLTAVLVNPPSRDAAYSSKIAFTSSLNKINYSGKKTSLLI